jgi:hypothetical protein
MLKSVVFSAPYEEAGVRKILKVFEKFASVKVNQVSVYFASQPNVQFEFTGEGPDQAAITNHLIQQMNMTEKSLKEATA